MVASVGYTMLFVFTYVLVELFSVRPEFSYGISISLVYVWSYMANTFFVFKVDSNQKRMFKYILFLIFSWFINNLFFNVLVIWFGVYYIVAMIINVILLSILRFAVQKKFVFN